jgi:hypothetical protein
LDSNSSLISEAQHIKYLIEMEVNGKDMQSSNLEHLL